MRYGEFIDESFQETSKWFLEFGCDALFYPNKREIILNNFVEPVIVKIEDRPRYTILPNKYFGIDKTIQYNARNYLKQKFREIFDKNNNFRVSKFLKYYKNNAFNITLELIKMCLLDYDPDLNINIQINKDANDIITKIYLKDFEIILSRNMDTRICDVNIFNDHINEHLQVYPLRCQKIADFLNNYIDGK